MNRIITRTFPRDEVHAVGIAGEADTSTAVKDDLAMTDHVIWTLEQGWRDVPRIVWGNSRSRDGLPDFREHKADQ